MIIWSIHIFHNAQRKNWMDTNMHWENAGPSYYFLKFAFHVSKIHIKRKFYCTIIILHRFFVNIFISLRRKRTVEENYFTCIVLRIHSVLSQCVSTSFIEIRKLSFLAFYSFRHIIVKFINNSVRCDLCEFIPRRKYYSFRGSVYSNISDAMHLYSLTRDYAPIFASFANLITLLTNIRSRHAPLLDLWLNSRFIEAQMYPSITSINLAAKRIWIHSFSIKNAHRP